MFSSAFPVPVAVGAKSYEIGNRQKKYKNENEEHGADFIHRDVFEPAYLSAFNFYALVVDIADVFAVI